MEPRFHFTVTDVARFLGKSPVTLRGWERQGLITFPRDGADRKLTCDEVIEAGHRAHELNRITDQRRNLIITAMTILKIIEEKNQQ